MIKPRKIPRKHRKYLIFPRLRRFSILYYVGNMILVILEFTFVMVIFSLPFLPMNWNQVNWQSGKRIDFQNPRVYYWNQVNWKSLLNQVNWKLLLNQRRRWKSLLGQGKLKITMKSGKLKITIELKLLLNQVNWKITIGSGKLKIPIELKNYYWIR